VASGRPRALFPLRRASQPARSANSIRHLLPESEELRTRQPHSRHRRL
jgi:hypothetical protein